MNTPLLTPEERAELLAPRLIAFGRYFEKDHGRLDLQMQADAGPLVELVDAVVLSRGVYEFMTITRPGDLLNYLRLTVLPGDDFLEKELRRELYRSAHLPLAPSVAEMDRALAWCGDDTTPLAEAWQGGRSGALWRTWSRQLLARVKELQQRLRARPDVLLRKEIALMDAGEHRRDDLPGIARGGGRPELRTPFLPPSVSTAIVRLVKALELPAVAADERGFDLWHGLCELQMQRADATGQAPDDALALFASDNGIPLQPPDWGGAVHVSWEGMRVATVMVMPEWRTFEPARAGDTGSLQLGLCAGEFGDAPIVRFASGLECTRERCLMMATRSDFGVLGCAWRLPVGGWVIYVEKTLGVGLKRLREIVEAP